MAALAIYAASQRQICRKREGVLRQRNAKNEWRESPQTTSSLSARFRTCSESPVWRAAPLHFEVVVNGRNGPEAFLIRTALQMAAVCRAPCRLAALLQRT